MKQGDYFSDYFKQKRKDDAWKAANKQDIERRMAGFKAAYDKIVEEYHLRISHDGSGIFGLFDIDHEEIGFVAEIPGWA